MGYDKSHGKSDLAIQSGRKIIKMGFNRCTGKETYNKGRRPVPSASLRAGVLIAVSTVPLKVKC